MKDDVGEAGIAAAEGLGAGFFFFLASALPAFADCAEDSVAEALMESALFGADCADADVAQAITVTEAKAVVHIFLGNTLPMPADVRACFMAFIPLISPAAVPNCSKNNANIEHRYQQ